MQCIVHLPSSASSSLAQPQLAGEGDRWHSRPLSESESERQQARNGASESEQEKYLGVASGSML